MVRLSHTFRDMLLDTPTIYLDSSVVWVPVGKVWIDGFENENKFVFLLLSVMFH